MIYPVDSIIHPLNNRAQARAVKIQSEEIRQYTVFSNIAAQV